MEAACNLLGLDPRFGDNVRRRRKAARHGIGVALLEIAQAHPAAGNFAGLVVVFDHARTVASVLAVMQLTAGAAACFIDVERLPISASVTPFGQPEGRAHSVPYGVYGIGHCEAHLGPNGV